MNLRLHRHGTVDSTNERAFAALAEGTARHGDLHVAEAQTRGRGRLGRRWESPPGEGLYASLVLLPEPPAPRPAALTMGMGLAVCDALGWLGLEGARLKWPNDVLVAGAKLCGILVEARGFRPERPHFVAGIGINVAQRSFPPELLAERPVTSLALLGLAPSTESVLDALGKALPGRLEQGSAAPEALARDYLAATGLAQARVRVTCAEREVRGRLETLGWENGLVLRLEDGRTETVALEHAATVEAL